MPKGNRILHDNQKQKQEECTVVTNITVHQGKIKPAVDQGQQTEFESHQVSRPPNMFEN